MAVFPRHHASTHNKVVSGLKGGQLESTPQNPRTRTKQALRMRSFKVTLIYPRNISQQAGE